jgi:hypothetical protein
MASADHAQQILAAAQLYAQAPGQAIEQLQPIANAGDSTARALIAFFMLQQGQIDEGLPYARAAAQEGYGQIAQMYAVDLTQRGRPELREMAPEFVNWALQSGWPIDVFSLIVGSAQQGEPAIVDQLLASGRGPYPHATTKLWDDLVAKAEGESAQISAAASQVTERRDGAITSINSEEEAIRDRRASAEQAADELGLVLSDVAAHSLAKDYGKDAKRTDNQARGYTIVSISLGCLSIAASLYGLLTLKEGSGIDTALARAAFGLPFALFIPYMNSLASAHRKEAWRLRHVELQIRTANPFLTLLDDERRKETLATLALRFFPGQEAIEKGDDAQTPSVPLDLIQALRLLLKEQQPRPVAPTISPAEPV